MHTAHERAVTLLRSLWLTPQAADATLCYFDQYFAFDLAHCYFESKLDQSEFLPPLPWLSSPQFDSDAVVPALIAQDDSSQISNFHPRQVMDHAREEYLFQ